MSMKKYAVDLTENPTTSESSDDVQTTKSSRIDLLAVEKDHGKSGQDFRVTVKLLQN